MKIKNIIIVITLLPQILFAEITSDLKNEVISNDQLISLLDTSNEEINQIVDFYELGNEDKAIEQLAAYFKNKMASSYYFNWKNFEERFKYYTETYPDRINEHKRRKVDHLSLFPAETKWKLPITGLSGEEINAYKLRHLARSHKMIDIGFCYYIEDKKIEYKNYFVEQVKSLGNAYNKKEYETDGNDVFEYFRSGYRVFNWLFTHNLFLASEDYSTEDQIILIKTFLYHGTDLYDKTKKYTDGNHHTKGLMALSLISILFDEFKEAEKWLNHSIKFLTKHLQQEINTDGFQFERSVHYHVGDIDNYFYVYYLAKLNRIDVSNEFEQRFKSMFDALIKIALPNGKLPVLQDDTDAPWAEYNHMHSPMYIGALLFQESEHKYFSKSKPSSNKYWFFRNEDFDVYEKIEKQRPELNSTSLKETGYYMMRNGWDDYDPAMIITAGLSDKKPDHQHGDMLGIYAYANDQVILPNYQVRYFLKDFPFFKNSFVKNVALVDSIPHGQNWKGNRGGSGFGKFKKLPNPKTISWLTDNDFDLFVGTHDGYSNIGVNYFRKVIFIKDGFWIVKDEFLSNEKHNYQQVWQGHFSMERNNHLRTTFANGSGLDIIQMNVGNFRHSFDCFRGKGNVVLSNEGNGNFNFTTILYPFADFEERGEAKEKIELSGLGEWSFNNNGIENERITINADHIINNNNTYICLNIKSFCILNNFTAQTNGDLILKISENEIEVFTINTSKTSIIFNNDVNLNYEDTFRKIKMLNCLPGEKYSLNIGNQ